MIDVGGKAVTHRRALARGAAQLTKAAFEALRDRRNPKGDVLALAEAAGLMAAKRTAELIPLCHPLPLTQVRLAFRLDESAHRVEVSCEAAAEAKTGVEMEALCGVSGALLTIYDLSKAVDPLITLTGIELVRKEGGKQGLWERSKIKDQRSEIKDHELINEHEKDKSLADLRCAVITVSDRAARGERKDESGPRAAEFLKARGATVMGTRIVTDDREQIEKAALAACAEKADVVILSGGTGVGPRDVTPETIQGLCDRWIPGIGERLRASGAAKTEMSWLSRSGGGLRGRTLLVALPGSPRAVEEGLSALENILAHAVQIAGGANHG
jgi:molybdenum cofactor biosynthesis protein MoaC